MRWASPSGSSHWLLPNVPKTCIEATVQNGVVEFSGTVSGVRQRDALRTLAEAVLVNLAVTDELALIFCALQDTRKCTNLRRDPRIAVVIGWDDDKTLQYEGIADEPVDPELETFKQIYAASRANAAAQMQWPGLTFFRVWPKWPHLSDYGRPWSVEELTF